MVGKKKSEIDSKLYRTTYLNSVNLLESPFIVINYIKHLKIDTRNE